MKKHVNNTYILKGQKATVAIKEIFPGEADYSLFRLRWLKTEAIYLLKRLFTWESSPSGFESPWMTQTRYHVNEHLSFGHFWQLGQHSRYNKNEQTSAKHKKTLI